MSNSEWEQLTAFLKDGGIDSRAVEIAGRWETTNELTPKCPYCGSGLTSHDGGHVCKGSERHLVDSEEVTSAASRLDVEVVLYNICETLGMEVSSPVKTDTLPDAAAVEVSSGAYVTLVCDPRFQEETLDRVFGDSVRNQRVNAVFTPDTLEGSVWEQISKYPVGGLAPPFPLSLLDTPEVVSDIIEQAVAARDRNEVALELQEMESGLFELLNQNPRLIESELSYTRILRENGSGLNLGNRLEDVAKAAFMTMDMPLQPWFGGKSGENITDIAAKLPSAESYGGTNPVLALVDTKSNSEKNLSDENIVQKHAEYLEQVNPQSFEGWHVAHVFVVYQMAGKSANELDWYDAIQDTMRSSSQYSGETTMVVLFAGALAHLVDARLSIAQRNQMNLSISNLRDSLHALFNYREFYDRIPDSITRMTRVDADSESDLSEADEEYIEGYHQREQLLVITPEMVDAYLREIMTNEEYNIVGADLSKYPSKW